MDKNSVYLVYKDPINIMPRKCVAEIRYHMKYSSQCYTYIFIFTVHRMLKQHLLIFFLNYNNFDDF